MIAKSFQIQILMLLVLTSFGCHVPGSENAILKDKPAAKHNDVLYQYSIIDALLAGVYDGNMTFAGIRKHGDFGIGTFNHLDGELLMNEGEIYRIRYDGSIKDVPDSDSTGLAFVKYFKTDTVITISQKNLTYTQLKDKLSNMLNRNAIYAIRIKSTFSTMSCRAPKPAQQPYLPLKQYMDNGGQSNFNFKYLTGTCVGFLMPPYMARTNVPGFHVHFIADDHKFGGHIFEFTTDKVMVEIDRASGFMVELNNNSAIDTADLDRNRAIELSKVE